MDENVHSETWHTDNIYISLYPQGSSRSFHIFFRQEKNMGVKSAIFLVSISMSCALNCWTMQTPKLLSLDMSECFKKRLQVLRCLSFFPMVSYEIPQVKNVAQAVYYPGTGWIFLRRRAPDAELWSRRKSKMSEMTLKWYEMMKVFKFYCTSRCFLFAESRVALH